MTGTREDAGNRIWTERARDYGWDTNASLASRLKADLVRKYATPTASLCDVGCGNGLFLRALASRCASVTGVDLNVEMLAEARAMIAREQISNVDLIRGSADAMPFRDGMFDLVYCFSTLLLVPDVSAALGEMTRVLRDGGFLVLDVAGRYNLSSIYWNLWYRRRGHFGVRAFSYGAISRRLDAVGCRLIESHGLGFCDQWKYVPGLHRIKALDRLFHQSLAPERNLDYRISNRPGIFPMANRWYIVARKGKAR